MNGEIKQNVVNLIRRSTENNTHSNIVDDSIKEITSWKVRSVMHKLVVVLYIITFGIFWLVINVLWKNLFIQMSCIFCEVDEADYIVIIDEDNKRFIIKLQRENFFFKNKILSNHLTKPITKSQLINSPYKGSEFMNKREETIVMYFRNNKYMYVESLKAFMPVIFELMNFKNEEIHEKLGLKRSDNRALKGIRSLEEYNYLLNKYGINEIDMNQKKFIFVFLEQFKNPFYAYQIYTTVVWCLNSYFQFAIIILSCTCLILLINTIHQYRNYLRILNFNSFSPAHIKREFQMELQMFSTSKNKSKIHNGMVSFEEEMKQNDNFDKSFDNGKNSDDSVYIVPGDLIELGNEDTIPCDCLILDGYCSVNESDLTGESNLVIKVPTVCDNREFNYDANSKSFLFQGTKINKCESIFDSDRRTFHAIAINTGYNTIRGNLIQNLMFPKPTNFNFYTDVRVFFICMLCVWIIANAVIIFISYEFHWETSKLLKKIFENITIIIPPTLTICLTFTTFYFHWNLSTKNISCINDLRMTASGRVNILVLDKTGTLTEEGLEIYGFQTTKTTFRGDFSMMDRNLMQFDNIQINTLIMNRVHKSFWKEFCNNRENENFYNYQTDPQNNIIFFLQCLATCHSIDKLRNDSLGNSIDKKMFDKLHWLQEKNENFLEGHIKYYFTPKNSYKISEKYIFKKLQHDQKTNYKLALIKRFEFSSKYQSMSVIIKNCLDDSFRFFIKGAPEKISQLCNPKSVPENFDEKLIEYTKKGCRVLACATKLLNYSDTYHIREDRHKFEDDLIFLGFIIFKNRLKRDTKHVISNLKNSNCKLVMATGDNPFTSLSVARECEMIENFGKLAFLIDLEKSNHSDIEQIKITSLFKDEEDNLVANVKMKETNIRPNHNYRMQKQNNHNKLIKSTQAIELTNINGNSPRNNYINTSKNLIEVQKTNYEQELFNNLKMIMKNDAVLLVSGKGFNYILQKVKTELLNVKNKRKSEQIKNSSYSKFEDNESNFYNELLGLIDKKGRIFYRMSPSNKVDLVNFFKEDKSSIVAMCGDGANDCGALLAADVGISVRQSKGNNITAHFYSSEESIGCIEIILKTGRACYENSLSIFKYMILYSTIQMTTSMLCYTIDREFISQQFLYIDCFITLIGVLLASRTGPNYMLINDHPPSKIFNSKFFTSLLGHTIIQVSSQVLYFIYFKNYRVNMNTDIKTDFNEGVLTFNSYLFIFTSFQYISLLFVINSNSKHRKAIYANKSFIFYLTSLCFFTSSFVTLNSYKRVFFGKILCSFENLDSNRYQELYEFNRVVTLAWALGNFLITYIYEYLVDYFYEYKLKK